LGRFLELEITRACAFLKKPVFARVCKKVYFSSSTTKNSLRSDSLLVLGESDFFTGESLRFFKKAHALVISSAKNLSVLK
jgi:hypothetical protein